jgi:hypothetical protein
MCQIFYKSIFLIGTYLKPSIPFTLNHSLCVHLYNETRLVKEYENRWCDDTFMVQLRKFGFKILMEPCEIHFLINFYKQKLIMFVQLVWKLQMPFEEFLRAPHFGRIIEWSHLNKQTTIFTYNKVFTLMASPNLCCQDIEIWHEELVGFRIEYWKLTC